MDDWSFVGGRLCLDFANHLYTFEEGDPCERLSRVVAWSRLAGSLDDDDARRFSREIRRSAVAKKVIDRARALGSSIKEIFSAIAAEETPDASDLAVLNRELADALSHSLLVPSEDGYMWDWSESTTPDRVLWPVARSAADLLISDDVARVKQCDGCPWLYVDVSKNRHRRWCDMKVCGNRSKVRRFRERQRKS